MDGVGSAARLANPRALVLLPGGSVVFSDTQYTYDIEGNIIAKNSSLRLATPPPRVPVITSATSAQAAQSVPFNYAIVATGFPTNYVATGLPAGVSINSGTGVISGIPAESGVFNISLGAGNAVGDCQATLSLTIAPPTYSAWQAVHFTATELTETTLAAVGSDADGDGFANFIEYALGSNPRAVRSVPFIQTTLQGGYLLLTYNRLRAQSSSNLTITPEVSTDLQIWRSGASYLQEISALPLDTAREQVVVRSLSPLSTFGRSFLRLKIQTTAP